MLDYCLSPEWVEMLRKRKRHFFMQFPDQGAHGLRGGLPCPFLLMETLQEYAKHGVDGMFLLGVAEMHWVNRVLMRKYPGGVGTDELWHQGQAHIGPDDKRIDLFWDNQSSDVAGNWRNLHWLEPGYDLALGYLDRGLEEIRAATSNADAELQDEIDRVEAFRRLLATQANKVKVQALWGKIEELENHPRVEGSEALAGARIAIRQIIGQEIENVRGLIPLLEKDLSVLQWAMLEESRASLGAGVIDKLRRKAELMEKSLTEQTA